MTPAYDESVLSYAADCLGAALDYSVNGLQIDGQAFLNLFVISGIAAAFEAGSPKYITGMSGRDMADEVFTRCGKTTAQINTDYNGDYSCAYWCGWILAQYQWQTGISFHKILSVLPYAAVADAYGVLHEAAPEKAYDVFNGVVRAETFLARMRKKRGMTQAALAAAANVSLRSIQLYEQRQNDIGKAQYNNLKDIAAALHCPIEDILE